VPGPIETEVKLRLPDLAAGRTALGRAGARLARPCVFEDNALYDDREGRLGAGGCVLRLRRVDGRGIVTFKGPKRVEGGVRSRPEHETEVQDADAFEAILAGLGYVCRFRYQKRRETWSLPGVEVVLDDTPIGAFLEVEGPAPAIHAAAVALGFSPADYVAASYAELFVAGGGVGDMVFR
jgi:adenylate cyclase class 2